MPTQDDEGVFREQAGCTHAHRHTQILKLAHQSDTQAPTIDIFSCRQRRSQATCEQAGIFLWHQPRPCEGMLREAQAWLLDYSLYAFLLHSSNVSCVTACFFPVFGCFGCLEAMLCCPGQIQLSKIPHTATIRIDFFLDNRGRGN